MFIKFENRHGKFDLTIGREYGIVVRDVKNGNTTPKHNIKALREEDDNVVFRKNEEEITIMKEVIVSEIIPFGVL